MLEVSIVDFVLAHVAELTGAEGRRGPERGYPDIELSGDAFARCYHAVDVKVAKRAINKQGRPTGRTQSRITLYTGNTYSAIHNCAGLGRSDHSTSTGHTLGILGIHTLLEDESRRVRDLDRLLADAPGTSSTGKPR